MSFKRKKELHERIRGPVYPILPAFDKAGRLDEGATRKYIRFLTGHGVRTLMVTAGTSRFHVMNEQEIAELNRIVIEENNRKSVVIAAGPVTGSTHAAIRLGRKFEEMGADAYMLYYPERHYGEAHILNYVEDISRELNLGIMIHALPVQNGRKGIPFLDLSLDFWKRLSEIDNFIGMKEESANLLLRFKLGTRFGHRLSMVVAGGCMTTFMSIMHFGVPAYLAGIGNIRPDIEEKFYDHILDKEYDQALALIKKYEEPFFDVAVPMGWHIALKAALNVAGLMPIYEKSPLSPLSDADREKISKTLALTGMISDNDNR